MMKRFSMLPFVFLVILLTVSCGSGREKKKITETQLSTLIRINQVGYFPDLGKRFTVADSTAEKFSVVNESGKVIYKGKLSAGEVWDPSGEYLMTGDFSPVIAEGKYCIYVPGVGKSYPFKIGKGIYRSAAVASMETFYFMRASLEMDSLYLGKFSRPMGHPDDTCYYHESTGYKKGFRSSPGGWYDAGDYGKYIVNASIATGTMLALYELEPGLYSDGTLDIPERDNGVNDLLDELRYEFEWVLTMQDDDGGVFHKLTSLMHDGITMPHETHSTRYLFAKSTAASLDFAAMLAQAARLYAPVDKSFSERCLASSRRAYQWAQTHPNRYFSNPPGSNTGSYGDRQLKEEFFWAAAELFCTTGEREYYEKIEPALGDIQFRLGESWRSYVDNIGYYSLFLSDKIGATDRKKLEEGIVRLAGQLIESAEKNPYGIPISGFVWGSNSDVLNTAMVTAFAYEISGERRYLDAAVMFTDYIFGRNATGYSFVSGFGTHYSRNFHHRLLMADQHDETFPGYVAGGPNGRMQDAGNLESSGAAYGSTLPAKAYIDHDGSYASNEICINWNAPLVFMLAYLDSRCGMDGQ